MSTTLIGAPENAHQAEWRSEARQRTIPLSASAALFSMDLIGLVLLWPLILLAGNVRLEGWPGAAIAALYPCAAIAAHYALGLYRRETSVSLSRALKRVPVAAVMAMLGASAILAPFAPDVTRPASYALVCSLLAGSLSRLGFDVMRRRGLLSRQILVLGAGARAWEMMHVLNREGRTLGYRLHFMHDPALGQIDERLATGVAGPVLRLGSGGVYAIARSIRPDEIVVAPDDRRGMNLQDLLDCKIAGYPSCEHLTFMEREARRIDMKRLDMGWLLYTDGFFMGVLDRALKRLLDVSASLLLLVPASPFLLAAMAVIRLQDGGPAFYRQTRVTQGGRPFKILKLRTMRTDAERTGAAWASKDGDSRVTSFGRFLRRTRIDELPQLWNVLRGDMSFVGPRPERPEFVDMLAERLPLYRERHAAKAGLTGWAQINYPYGASIDDARSKLSYDLYYVKNFSFLLDILIIVQTIRVVFFPGSVK